MLRSVALFKNSSSQASQATLFCCKCNAQVCVVQHVVPFRNDAFLADSDHVSKELSRHGAMLASPNRAAVVRLCSRHCSTYTSSVLTKHPFIEMAGALSLIRGGQLSLSGRAPAQIHRSRGIPELECYPAVPHMTALGHVCSQNRTRPPQGASFMQSAVSLAKMSWPTNKSLQPCIEHQAECSTIKQYMNGLENKNDTCSSHKSASRVEK